MSQETPTDTMGPPMVGKLACRLSRLVALVRDGKIAVMRSYLSDETTLERLGLLE
jgi:hypothetical protein